MKILVTDRSRNVRQLLKRELAADGHTVLMAKDGFEASRMIELNPDLEKIILDPDLSYIIETSLLMKIRKAEKSLEVIIHGFEAEDKTNIGIQNVYFIQKVGKSVEKIKKIISCEAQV